MDMYIAFLPSSIRDKVDRMLMEVVLRLPLSV